MTMTTSGGNHRLPLHLGARDDVTHYRGSIKQDRSQSMADGGIGKLGHLVINSAPRASINNATGPSPLGRHVCFRSMKNRSLSFFALTICDPFSRACKSSIMMSLRANENRAALAVTLCQRIYFRFFSFANLARSHVDIFRG